MVLYKKRPKNALPYTGTLGTLFQKSAEVPWVWPQTPACFVRLILISSSSFLI